MRYLMIAVFALMSTAFAADLNQAFDFGGARSPETQYFVMTTEFLKYSPNGERTSRDHYTLYLVADPTNDPGNPEFTCQLFKIQFGETDEQTIPGLQGWSYTAYTEEGSIDEQGQVLGVPHSKFENLTDSAGKNLDAEHSYAVYNNFIDFHSFCDLFARPIPGANGIQELHHVGDHIVHAAAFTEPPVNLGSKISKGSVFRNGKVTMEFKGLSRMHNRDCAIIAYDSGESSFVMNMQPMPNMIVNTQGSSHYFGDMFLDLQSLWLQRCQLAEFVVSQTDIESMNMTINGIVERRLEISNVDQTDFNAAIKAVE